MRVQVRLNAISPYQSQQSSPAIQDITVSSHTRHLCSGDAWHLCLWPYETPPLRPYKPSPLRRFEAQFRLRPVYATLPPLATLCGARNKQTHKHDTQLVIPIVASLKHCLSSERVKSTIVALNIELTSNYHTPIAFVNFVWLSFVSAFVSISATLLFLCT